MKKAKQNISAVFEFNNIGNLKTIFLNAENENDQKILEKALRQIFKPYFFDRLRELFFTK